MRHFCRRRRNVRRVLRRNVRRILRRNVRRILRRNMRSVLRRNVRSVQRSPRGMKMGRVQRRRKTTPSITRYIFYFLCLKATDIKSFIRKIHILGQVPHAHAHTHAHANTL